MVSGSSRGKNASRQALVLHSTAPSPWCRGWDEGAAVSPSPWGTVDGSFWGFPHSVEARLPSLCPARSAVRRTVQTVPVGCAAAVFGVRPVTGPYRVLPCLLFALARSPPGRLEFYSFKCYEPLLFCFLFH